MWTWWKFVVIFIPIPGTVPGTEWGLMNIPWGKTTTTKHVLSSLLSYSLQIPCKGVRVLLLFLIYKWGNLKHRHLVSYSRSHSRIQTQPSGPTLMHEWEHLCSCVHMWDFICSHMYACVNACVCVHMLYICVSGKARIQVQICLMQRMHSHTIVSKFKKKENSNWYFCLTLRSAEFSCVHCLSWIKERYTTKSSIYRSRSLPGKWK